MHKAKYWALTAGLCLSTVLSATVASAMPAATAHNGQRTVISDITRLGNQQGSEDKTVDVVESASKTDTKVRKYIPDYLKTVRLSWEPVPGAVSYQVAIMRANKNLPENVVSVKRGIFTNGYELDTSVMRTAKDYYWKVCPLDASGKYIKLYSDLRPLVDQELNPKAPKPTTEFESMAYAPLYPVFSWVPAKDGKYYDIRVYREENGKPVVIRELSTEGSVYYEDAGYTWPGKYYWQVRSRNESGTHISEWSTPSWFQVSNPVKVAALGDSITHGGGAVSTPPGYVMYNWETYSQVPIKNLGYSGDTVAAMDARFETDVLPFHPKILVIMGGVNDFRSGAMAQDIIYYLQQIGNKCRMHGIIPVYATATPINPHFIANWSYITTPAVDWKEQQVLLNQWIMSQQYAVDVASGMTDCYGLLMDEATTDGLHPDVLGKKLIGETISDYLLRTFPGKNLLAK